MDDIVSTNRYATAKSLATILASHNGQETTLLDLSELSAWTDYFIVTTATSSTHLRGLMRHALDEGKSLRLEPYKKPSLTDDDEWCLIDFGWIVVHIMSVNARSFYELETLWFQAKKIEVECPVPEKATQA